MRSQHTNVLLVSDAFPGLEFRACEAKTGHPLHFHEEFQFTLLRQSRGSFQFGPSRCDLLPGQVCVGGPNEVHQGNPLGSQGWQPLMLFAPPALVQQVMDTDEVWPAFRCKHFDGQTEPVAPLLWAAYESFHNPATLLEQETALTFLFRRTLLEKAVAPIRPTGEHRAITTAIDYIKAHYTGTIRLDTLATLGGLSKFHFLRVFRQQVGLPPHTFQIQLRIADARQRLRRGEAVPEVAQAVGCSDQAHLTRLLRTYYDTTPAFYQKTAISFKNGAY